MIFSMGYFGVIIGNLAELPVISFNAKANSGSLLSPNTPIFSTSSVSSKPSDGFNPFA